MSKEKDALENQKIKAERELTTNTDILRVKELEHKYQGQIENLEFRLKHKTNEYLASQESS